MFWPRWLSDLWRLVRAWWTHDRIEVVRSDSRWLQLREGDVVLVEGVAATICRRVVVKESSEVILEYRCQTASGPARLHVMLGAESVNDFRISWEVGGATRCVEMDLCAVYAARPTKA